MNYFGQELNAYKANLHTHSKVSDGAYTPQELIDRYAQAGYDVLAFTEHRKTNPVSTYDPKGMTLISGMELHPKGPRGIVWHILGLNIPEDMPYPADPPTGQDAVDLVRNAGGIAFCAHPYWCGLTSAEVNTLQGIEGIEVYNASCRIIGRQYNMQCWDELLDMGRKFNAIAVDDIHWDYDIFRGFTMILAEDKSLPSLMKALKEGRYYSTRGPLFHSITFENKILRAEFSEAVSVNVVQRRSAGFNGMLDQLITPYLERKPVTSLEMDCNKLKDNYIRIQICDKNSRMAWSNPIWI
ncbi:MAG: CehA/McbA family metallohydrolase [Lentisphaeria bacterium]|nr:CehA/McbA family metallohydrolase [Lentisphaeria bacterium]